MGKTVSYARVSSRKQNLDHQLIALQQYGPKDMIVTDKASGKNLDRPGYQSLKIGIRKLVKGDILIVKSFVRVKILAITPTMVSIPDGQDWVLDMINNILIEILTSIAENERKTIKKRQAEGMAACRLTKSLGKR